MRRTPAPPGAAAPFGIALEIGREVDLAAIGVHVGGDVISVMDNHGAEGVAGQRAGTQATTAPISGCARSLPRNCG